MTAESAIVRATQEREKIAEAGRNRIAFEMTVPKPIAALMSGIPKASLNLPILPIPLDEQIQISVCSDNRQMAIKTLEAWANSDNFKLRGSFLARQYRALYQFAQRGHRGTATDFLTGEAGLFLDILRQDESWESILDHAIQTGRIEETDLETVGQKMIDLWQQLAVEIRNANSSIAPENALSSITGS